MGSLADLCASEVITKKIDEAYEEGYNKAIDEFAEWLLDNAPRNFTGELELGGLTCYLSANKVMEIAEQLKGGAE